MILVLISTVAAASWFFTDPGGWLQLIACILQACNAVLCASAAVALLIVWAPSILTMLQKIQLAERTVNAAVRVGKSMDESMTHFLRACRPKKRAYHTAYVASCVLTLLSWIGLAPVPTGRGGPWLPVGFPWLPGACTVACTLLFPLQLLLYHTFERQRREQQAVAPSAPPPAAANEVVA